MKGLIISFAVVTLASAVVMAGVGNNGKCHPVFGCGGQGDKGDKGDIGEPGKDGSDGTDGAAGDPGERGADGKAGIDGVNANTSIIEDSIHHLNETQYILQGEIRLLDTRKFGLNVFGQYDVRHTRGHQIGVGLLYKIGKSYEEKQIEALQEKIKLLLEHAHYPMNSQILLIPEVK